MAEVKLASAGDDIRLWDSAAGYTLLKQFNPHPHNISGITFTHDNTALASVSTGGDKVVLTYTNAAAYSYDIAAGEGRTCIAFNSTSRYLMGGGADGSIQVWDLKTRKLKKTYSDHRSAVTSVTFNWNDTDIASGSESGEIILFNVVSAVGSSPLIAPKVQAVRQVKYSMFKRSLLGAVSDDGAVNLWDTNRRSLIHSFSGQHKAPATGLVFSPLNEMLMMSVGLDKRIVCYDVQNKMAVKTMVAESPLTSIDLMHDGATLAVGSTRGKIYIYDLRQGATPVSVVSAHKSSVQCLKFQNNIKSVPKVESGRGTKVSQSTKRPPSTVPSSNVTNGNRATNGNTGSSDPRADINANQPATQGAVYDQVNSNEQLEPVMSTLNPADTDINSDFFSPIRDRIAQPRWTPKLERTPQRVPGSGAAPRGGDGQTAGDRQQRSKTLHPPNTADEFSDEVFSPISGSGDPNAVNVRGYPIGGTPSHVSPRPVPTRLASTLDMAAVDRHNNVPNDAYDVNGHMSGGMSSGSRSQASSKSSLLQDDDSLPASSTEDLRSRKEVPRSKSSHSRVSIQSLEDNQAGSSVSSHHKASEGLSNSTPATTPGAEEGAVGGAPAAMGAFHTEVIRNMVEEVVDELRDNIRKDFLHLYMDIIKQFQIHQAETRSLIQQHSVNDELMAEIHRLREENKKLKQKF